MLNCVHNYPSQIIAASQDLMEALMPMVGSIAVIHREDEDQDDGESQGGAVTGRSSLAGYAVQLVLSGIEARLKELSSPLSEGAASQKLLLLRAVRPGLVVQVAQEAPDSAVRNAALSLVSELAGLMPEAVLGHVLQVCGGGADR